MTSARELEARGFTMAEASFIQDMESEEEELGVSTDVLAYPADIGTVLTPMDQLELKVRELSCQVESMEKSIKDTNKKITAIRNQLRKEKGRGKL